MLRDKRREKKYFDEAITFVNEYISEEIDYLQKTKPLNPLAGMKTSQGLFTLALDKLEYYYSRGDHLDSLIETVNDLLVYREMQKKYADLLPEADVHQRVEWESLDFENYKKTFTWLLFAINAGVSKEHYKKILLLTDNSGLDIIFDRIAIKLGDTERPIASKALHVKPYGLLLDAIDATPDQQALLMNKFMDAWYQACTKNGFYDTHNITNNFGYRGYWCFEAALIVKLYNIDDSSFRDHQYYPAALVHGD